jgi:hypothetical protein
VETTQIYLEATLAMKEQALAKTTRPKSKHGRYRPAAKQNALAEIGYDGTVLHVRTLDPDRHRQTEGIELTTDGRMLLGDEGAGKRARLSVYSK